MDEHSIMVKYFGLYSIEDLFNCIGMMTDEEFRLFIDLLAEHIKKRAMVYKKKGATDEQS